MKRIDELFDVKYGVNLELNTLTEYDKANRNAVNFVSRTAENNGVSAIVERLADVDPISAGTISVAAGGSVLETFLQPEPYYSGRDLFFLTSKAPMTEVQKLYYCTCLRANKYRYNYGRQANKTLGAIMVPDINCMPSWVDAAQVPSFDRIDTSVIKQSIQLDVANWKSFRYDELFAIERGTGPRKQDLDSGSTPFVTSTHANNGVTAYTDHIPTHKGNTIGVNRNGSVGEAFFQEQPFCSTEDVHVFNARFEMTKYVAMFLITLIRQEKYRFSYGRKWGIERMKSTTIRLPVDQNGNPDWGFMERFIESLRFSASI